MFGISWNLIEICGIEHGAACRAFGSKKFMIEQHPNK